MINEKRRTVVKSIGVAAATVATPSFAATSEPPATPFELHNDGKGIDLNVVTENTDGVSVTLTNHASSAASVKHIYPGIIQSRGRTFDINDILVNGPLEIGAGESVTVYMPKIAPHNIERAVPHGLTSTKPLTVSTLYRIPDGEQSVSTLRSFFS